MFYGEMVESVRLKIDDRHKTRFVNDEPLRLALNEAYQHVYRELIKNSIYTDVVETTIDFVSDSQEIEFGRTERNSIQKIVYVRDDNFNPIPIYREEFSKRSDVRSVYLKRTLIRLEDRTSQERVLLGWYIVPSSNFTVTVQYKPKFVGFRDNVDAKDFIEIVPKEHHDVIVLRAVVLLLGTDEDNSSFWFGLYREALQSMLDSVSLENEVAGEVVDVNDEFTWGQG